jgi:hypothetical protein
MRFAPALVLGGGVFSHERATGLLPHVATALRGGSVLSASIIFLAARDLCHGARRARRNT